MIFALVDCNNFYASCEQLFQPKLQGRPVVVLSNNDGCVVARSAEAKAIGIPMGEPWHKLKALARLHGIVPLSSNYALYADMSARVMRLLSTYSPIQDVYSVDECFLDLTGNQPTPIDCARKIRYEVKRQIGLPVCVGLGATKTLAKLANHVAKKRMQYEGVFSFHGLQPQEVSVLMASFPVGEVWGVGSKLSARLKAIGITNVRDLKEAHPGTIRRQFNVCLERTVRELSGEICFDLMSGPAERKQIFSSRSFGQLISELAPLEESVAAYASRAAEKLRQQKLLTGEVAVMLRTNPFRTDLPQYQKSYSISITPTDDTRHIAQAAIKLLRTLYRHGFAYQKTGILLTDLTSIYQRQSDLFEDVAGQVRSQALMTAVDRINQMMGRGTIKLLAEGTDQRWAMKAEKRTPRYTTRLDELPVVKMHGIKVL
jgi:DNA polymerase V